MKILLCFVLSLLSLSAAAFDVKCYSAGNLFYHHRIKHLYVGEGFIVNKDNPIKEVVMADCVISYREKI